MKTLHVHVSVRNLEDSVRFYNELFGAEPVTLKPDYAKWMLEDPRVNFAISVKDHGRVRINHLGIQAGSPDELEEIAARLEKAGQTTLDQKAAHCCYEVSDKNWVTDPGGVVWEVFHTTGQAGVYGDERAQSGDRPVKTDAGGPARCCSRSA